MLEKIVYDVELMHGVTDFTVEFQVEFDFDDDGLQKGEVVGFEVKVERNWDHDYSIVYAERPQTPGRMVEVTEEINAWLNDNSQDVIEATRDKISDDHLTEMER